MGGRRRTVFESDAVGRSSGPRVRLITAPSTLHPSLLLPHFPLFEALRLTSEVLRKRVGNRRISPKAFSQARVVISDPISHGLLLGSDALHPLLCSCSLHVFCSARFFHGFHVATGRQGEDDGTGAPPAPLAAPAVESADVPTPQLSERPRAKRRRAQRERKRQRLAAMERKDPPGPPSLGPKFESSISEASPKDENTHTGN